MAEDITGSWSVPYTITQKPGGCWWAESLYLNISGKGDTPREALTDMLKKNGTEKDGSLYFYWEGESGMTLEQVVDSLLPEPPFKVGDKVRDKELGLLIEGTVLCLEKDYLTISVVKHKNPNASAEVTRCTDEVELVPEEPTPEPKFKVGDRVKSHISGLVGVITGHGRYDQNSFAIRVEAHDYPWQVGQTLYRLPKDLELVEEEPPTPKPEPPFEPGDWAVCTDCGHVGRLQSLRKSNDEYFWLFMDEDEYSEHEEVHLLKLAPEWYKRLSA